MEQKIQLLLKVEHYPEMLRADTMLIMTLICWNDKEIFWKIESKWYQVEREHSVQFSHSVVSDSLWPHGLHTRIPCPSSTPGVCTNSCPSSHWCHPNILSSVILFSFCLSISPSNRSFLMSWLFASGGQSIGVSALASVLPMSMQDWSSLGWTGWISLQSKRLSRVFSNTTDQKHQFFGAQLFL